MILIFLETRIVKTKNSKKLCPCGKNIPKDYRAHFDVETKVYYHKKCHGDFQKAKKTKRDIIEESVPNHEEIEQEEIQIQKKPDPLVEEAIPQSSKDTQETEENLIIEDTLRKVDVPETIEKETTKQTETPVEEVTIQSPIETPQPENDPMNEDAKEIVLENITEDPINKVDETSTVGIPENTTELQNQDEIVDIESLEDTKTKNHEKVDDPEEEVKFEFKDAKGVTHEVYVKRKHFQQLSALVDMKLKNKVKIINMGNLSEWKKNREKLPKGFSSVFGAPMGLGGKCHLSVDENGITHLLTPAGVKISAEDPEIVMQQYFDSVMQGNKVVFSLYAITGFNIVKKFFVKD